MVVLFVVHLLDLFEDGFVHLLFTFQWFRKLSDYFKRSIELLQEVKRHLFDDLVQLLDFLLFVDLVGVELLFQFKYFILQLVHGFLVFLVYIVKKIAFVLLELPEVVVQVRFLCHQTQSGLRLFEQTAYLPFVNLIEFGADLHLPGDLGGRLFGFIRTFAKDRLGLFAKSFDCSGLASDDFIEELRIGFYLLRLERRKFVTGLLLITSPRLYGLYCSHDSWLQVPFPQTSFLLLQHFDEVLAFRNIIFQVYDFL